MPDTPMPLRTVRVAREIARRDILMAVARVPNSTRLLVGSSEGKVLELDASQTNAPVVEHANHGRYVTSIAISGETVISGSYDGKLIWWDTEKRAKIRAKLLPGVCRQTFSSCCLLPAFFPRSARSS